MHTARSIWTCARFWKRVFNGLHLMLWIFHVGSRVDNWHVILTKNIFNLKNYSFKWRRHSEGQYAMKNSLSRRLLTIFKPSDQEKYENGAWKENIQCFQRHGSDINRNLSTETMQKIDFQKILSWTLWRSDFLLNVSILSRCILKLANKWTIAWGNHVDE